MLVIVKLDVSWQNVFLVFLILNGMAKTKLATLLLSCFGEIVKISNVFIKIDLLLYLPLIDENF